MNLLIDYQNIDGGDSFKFNLGNKDRIKYFILSVYDQDGNTITQFSIEYFNYIPQYKKKVLFILTELF